MDAHGDGKPTVTTIARGLSQPSSVAWFNGSLFIAEPTRLLKIDAVDKYILSGQVLHLHDRCSALPGFLHPRSHAC